MPFYYSLKYERNKAFAKRTIDHLIRLREGLRQEIPTKSSNDTLLLATWNIRDFDSNKFRQGPRLPESIYYLAEIISSFDLVAVQEINEDLKRLKELMRILGPNWDIMITDVTDASLGGNGERLGYIYDKRKVLFRDIAGEIVLGHREQIGGGAVKFELPENHKIRITKDTTIDLANGRSVFLKRGDYFELEEGAHQVSLPKEQRLIKLRQFSRTPFLVAFQCGWFKFNLCTVHLYYGDSGGTGYERRVKEIEALAKYFKKRGKRDGENYILLGDFNVVDSDDDTYKALYDNGFITPQGVYKTNLSQNKYYDQIAFRESENEVQLGPANPNSGTFDFSKYVFRNEEYSTYKDLIKNTKVRDFHQRGSKKGQARTEDEKAEYYRKEWRTWQVSDHLLLWTELKINFADDYLKGLKSDLDNA